LLYDGEEIVGYNFSCVIILIVFSSIVSTFLVCFNTSYLETTLLFFSKFGGGSVAPGNAYAGVNGFI